MGIATVDWALTAGRSSPGDNSLPKWSRVLSFVPQSTPPSAFYWEKMQATEERLLPKLFALSVFPSDLGSLSATE